MKRNYNTTIHTFDPCCTIKHSYFSGKVKIEMCSQSHDELHLFTTLPNCIILTFTVKKCRLLKNPRALKGHPKPRNEQAKIQKSSIIIAKQLEMDASPPVSRNYKKETNTISEQSGINIKIHNTYNCKREHYL